jgi:hypothetical protein
MAIREETEPLFERIRGDKESVLVESNWLGLALSFGDETPVAGTDDERA